MDDHCFLQVSPEVGVCLNWNISWLSNASPHMPVWECLSHLQRLSVALAEIIVGTFT